MQLQEPSAEIPAKSACPCRDSRGAAALLDPARIPSGLDTMLSTPRTSHPSPMSPVGRVQPVCPPAPPSLRPGRAWGQAEPGAIPLAEQGGFPAGISPSKSLSGLRSDQNPKLCVEGRQDRHGEHTAPSPQPGSLQALGTCPSSEEGAFEARLLIWGRCCCSSSCRLSKSILRGPHVSAELSPGGAGPSARTNAQGIGDGRHC